MPERAMFRAIENKVSPNQRKMIINMFETAGHSIHSRLGLTLGVVINHCLDKGYLFRVEGSSRTGFYVESPTPKLSRVG